MAVREKEKEKEKVDSVLSVRDKDNCENFDMARKLQEAVWKSY